MPPIDPSRLPPNALGPNPQPQPFPGSVIGAPITTVGNVRDDKTGQDAAQEAGLYPYKLQVAKETAAEAREKLVDLPFNNGDALGDPHLTGAERLASVPDKYRPLVQLLVQGRYPALSSFALGKPQLMSLFSTAKAIDPTFDPSLFAPRLKALNDFTGAGRAASSIGAINREAGSLRLLKQASDALKNPGLGFAPLNKIVAWAEQNTGQKNIDAKQAYLLFADENARQIDRIMKSSGSSSGSTSVTGVEEIKNDLTNLNASTTRDAAFGAAAGMIAQALQPYQEQWDAAYGGNKAPPMWISKNSADFLSTLAPNENFHGDEWRGLPGLKGDGSPDQATPEGGHSPGYLDPDKTPAFKFPAAPGETNPEKAINPDLKPIELPAGYQDKVTSFLEQHPPGTLKPEDYINFRKNLDSEYEMLGVKGIQSTLDPKAVGDYVKSYNAGAVPANAPIPTNTVPTNLAERAMVSAPGVFAARAANAATLGIPSLLSGQEGRDAMHLASEAHPVAGTLGDIAGSIAPIAGLSNLAEKGIKSLGEGYLEREGLGQTAGSVAGNAAYGGTRGFNEADDGNGALGAVEGTAAGAAGGVTGNLVAKGANAFIPQSTKDAIASLGDTALTLPQKLGLGHTEEMFRAVPFARGAQASAAASWVRHMGDDVLGSIPDNLKSIAAIPNRIPDAVTPGVGSNAFVQEQLGNGYNVLKPKIGGSIDKTFIDNVNAALPKSGNTDVANGHELINDAMSNLYSDPQNGVFNGDSYVSTMGKLRQLENDFGTKAEAGDPIARQLMQTTQTVKNETKNLIFRRLADSGNNATIADLKGLEQAWAKHIYLNDATNRALSNQGVFSPGQWLTTTKKFTPDNIAAGTGFGQSAGLNAGKIMGASAVPEKPFLRDTAYTAGAGLLTGGILPALGTAAYAPGVKQLVTAALLKRPDIWKNLPIVDALAPGTNATSDAIQNFIMGR